MIALQHAMNLRKDIESRSSTKASLVGIVFFFLVGIGFHVFLVLATEKWALVSSS